MKSLQTGKPARSLMVGLTLVALALLGAATSALTVRPFRHGPRPGAPTNHLHMLRGRVRTGTELLGILMVSSACGGSRYAQLPSLVRQVRDKLAGVAAEQGWHFSMIGVDLDERPSDGLSFLQRFGPFDEVLAGGNWLNTGAIEYMVRDLPGKLAIPSIAIVRRKIVTEPTRLSVSGDDLVARLVGVTQIRAYSHILDSTRAGRVFDTSAYARDLDSGGAQTRH